MNPKFLKIGLFAALGASAGFAYYYFIGCNSGHCVISSNPYISTIYGLVAGVFMGWPTKQKLKEKDEKQS
ncbi:MAG: hypothetical protein D8M58_07990 [Calditrichaeota bacterium]|nr:MAG: hypothetical protein DWQ03_18500 [Calditrichota bacterium]MBL1205322.1 hypothetical protein [Calditrichota bacterium]NOG45151.1 hypothetical protein [Calditrichota bacterium]